MSRTQAHVLEAIATAMVLLTSVAFTLQVTAVTPLITNTSSQHIGDQQAAVADGILTTAVETDALKQTVLFMHPENRSFYDIDTHGYYVNDDPPTAFGEILDGSFLGRGIAFDIHLHYLRDREIRQATRLMYMDKPSDHAVSRTRLVTLTDDDVLTEPGTSPDGDPRAAETAATLKSVTTEIGETYFIQDESTEPLYAVVNMRVVVWQM